MGKCLVKCSSIFFIFSFKCNAGKFSNQTDLFETSTNHPAVSGSTKSVHLNDAVLRNPYQAKSKEPADSQES